MRDLIENFIIKLANILKRNTMTPKEKAKELFEKMYYKVQPDELGKDQESAQECALIAVNEILKEYWSHDTKRRDWWEEVKREIISL